MTPTECEESAPDGEQCSLIEQRCWCRAIIQDGKPEKEHTSKAHKKELKEKRIKKHKVSQFRLLLNSNTHAIEKTKK